MKAFKLILILIHMSVMMAWICASSVALAQTVPARVHFQGQIVGNSGMPLQNPSVLFTLQVTNPAGTCVLYEETQTLNMTSSNGVFDLSLGGGTPTVGGGSQNPSPPVPFKNAFSNAQPFSGLACSGGTYTPAASDNRLLKVSFNDGSQTETLSAPYSIASVPYALYADTADTLDGKSAAQFAQINSTTAALTQANLEQVFQSAGNVTQLMALISGTSTAAGTTNFSGGVSFSNPPTSSSAPSTATSLVNKTYSDDYIAGQAIAPATLSGLSGGSVPAGDVLSWTGSNWAATPVSDASKLPLAGGTMTGAIAMGGHDITNVGYITIAGSHYLGLGSYNAGAETALLGTLGPSYAGVTWYNSSTNQIKYWDGSSAVTLGASGAGLQSLNGLNANTQSFATGTAGTAPAFNSSGSTHTLNIPMASSPGITAGLIANTDYATIGKAILRDGTVAFTADESMGSHKLTNVTDPVGAQDAATKNYADLHIANKAVDPSIATLVTASAGQGDLLTWDMTGNRWTAAPPAATGSVTSVGLSLPSIFTVTNSPVTSSGTLMGTLATQAANTVFAGPSSGVPAAPTFRTLASGDLPTVAVAQGGTGSTIEAPNGIIMANGTGSSLTSNFCATGQALVATSASTWGCQSVTNASSTFVNGGNSFGAAAVLGTQDNFKLSFLANNATAMTILPNGNVGIGTATPGNILDVSANTDQAGVQIDNTQVGGQSFSLISSGAGSPLAVGAFAINDGNDFYFVMKNGKTGIGGVYNPKTPLHVLSSFSAAPATSGTNQPSASIRSEGGSTVLDIGSYGGSPYGAWLQADNPGDLSVTRPLSLQPNGGNVGIGTSAPGAALDVKGAIRLSGATSGYTGFQTAAAAGSTVWTLPIADGTSGQFLSTNGAGILSWGSASAGGITALTGDVTASGTGSVASTVAVIGGSSAASVHTAELAANAATNLDTASTIVKRDPSGNFAAGAISESSAIYRDGGSSTVTVQAPSTVTTSYVLKLPPATGTANQVMITDGAGNLSWSSILSSTLNSAKIFVGNGSNVATAVSLSGDAALSNTGALTLNTVTVGKGGTGATTQAPNGIIMADGTGSTLTSNFCATGQALVATSASTWGCQSVTSATSGFVNGGNSFGSAATLGTGDNYSLGFKANGATQMTILPNGNVGIGTTSPSGVLTINSTNTAYTGLTNANASLVLENPSGGGQSVMFFSFGGTPKGGVRGDSAGNFNWHATGGQGHQFYSSIDVSGPILGMSASGLEIGGAAGSTSGSKLSVNGNASIGYGVSQSAPSNGLLVSGNVGIGTTSPNSKVEVNGGAIVSVSQSSSSQCVNFGTGNMQVSAYAGTNTINLGGLADGGAYTIVLTGYTANQTVTLNGFTDAGCSTPVSVGVDFGGSASSVTSIFTAVGNTQVISLIYSVARGVVYASASTNFYR